ncbi:MAG: U32 family peptidase [Desulfobulbales bacterium]|nr:U32 family peptidase [Desulfobulbales bacterium]
MLKKPELLAPAGSFAKMRAAIHYGADAVYLGGQEFSLRAHAANFSENEIARAADYAHERGVKIYVTVNILAHNRDFAALPAYLESLGAAQVDGLIVSDPGIMRLALNTVPGLPIHLSTQANVTNLESARFWQEQGVKRINAARELSLAEIAEIKNGTDLEIEVFAHGALCISYSGRCLLSCYLTGRSANRGDCAHPCRYSYKLIEEKRPGQYFPVEEDQRGTYIFNSRDLCLLNRLPELIGAGVDCLKIEGRMKTIYYTGAVTRVYRAALDDLFDNWPETGLPVLDEKFMAELKKVGSRGYTENFLSDPPERKDMLYDESHLAPTHHPAGIVVEGGDNPLIDIRNPLLPGQTVEYLGRRLTGSSHRVIEIIDSEGVRLEKANPGNLVHLITEPRPDKWLAGALLRKAVPQAAD